MSIFAIFLSPYIVATLKLPGVETLLRLITIYYIIQLIGVMI